MEQSFQGFLRLLGTVMQSHTKEMPFHVRHVIRPGQFVVLELEYQILGQPANNKRLVGIYASVDVVAHPD